jgi:hypothetical protein
MNNIIGIDPGKGGGIAFYDSREHTASVLAMPDTDGDVVEYLTSLKARSNSDHLFCYIEKVGGYIAGNATPGSAMFNFGENTGFIRGVVMTLGIPVTLVPPQTWQKDFHGIRGIEKAERKRKLKEIAQRLYPNVSGITLKTADALLILHYGIHQV